MKQILPKTLKSQILLVVSSIALINALMIVFFVQKETKESLLTSEDQAAWNMVNAVMLNVEGKYKSLESYRESLIQSRKNELKNISSFAQDVISNYNQQYKENKLTLDQAQSMALKQVVGFRYNNNIGYFWINDTTKPIPRMLAHATIPELTGKIADDPRFNLALKSGKNLLTEFVDVCEEHGSGYVSYDWPKPTKQGVTPLQPKISYVAIFKPWNWIIGTGVYIDDIEKDTQKRLQAIRKELQDAFAKLKIGETGFMFVFNSKGDILVNNDRLGDDFSELKNPATGNILYKEMIQASKKQHAPFDYLGTKTSINSDNSYSSKRAYIEYFKPLDWYIGYLVHYYEIERPAVELIHKILYISFFSLAVAMILLLVLSTSLTTPLKQLAQAAKNVEEYGIQDAAIPVAGTAETRKLGIVLDKMIHSIRQGIAEKQKLLEKIQAANKNLTQTNQQLTFKNHELQEIVYVASHDLRSPLVNIQGFSSELITDSDRLLEIITVMPDSDKKRKMIKELIEHRLPESVNFITSSTIKMASLLDGLLQVSRVGTIKINRQILDIDKLAREVLSSLEYQIKENRIKVTIDTLPPCTGDEHMIDHIFTNLITNAIKYRDPAKKCEIKISGEIKENMAVYCVSDNGIGIAQQHQSKIFEMFHRLRPDDTAGGAGLGLTIVARILERLEGKVWLESEPAKGSKFYIALPTN